MIVAWATIFIVVQAHQLVRSSFVDVVVVVVQSHRGMNQVLDPVTTSQLEPARRLLLVIIVVVGHKSFVLAVVQELP